MMNFESGSARALLVLALGLAAISGISVVFEALGIPSWFVRLAVLTSFAETLVLAVRAGIKSNSVRLTQAGNVGRG